VVLYDFNMAVKSIINVLELNVEIIVLLILPKLLKRSACSYSIFAVASIFRLIQYLYYLKG